MSRRNARTKEEEEARSRRDDDAVDDHGGLVALSRRDRASGVSVGRGR